MLTWRFVLGKVDIEDIDEKLGLVVVDVLDVDGQVEVGLELSRNSEVVGLNAEVVYLLPLSILKKKTNFISFHFMIILLYDIQTKLNLPDI